jgi:carbon-monoxide dehydrogenase medium subunit
MYDFDYRRPDSIGEAAQLLAQQSEAKLLAGGMTLLPTMKLRLAQPSMLIDLSSVDGLRGISQQSDRVVIGAMTRHVDVARSEVVQRLIPGLAELAGGIGDRQVRNRGTLGGSVANSDPAACYPAGVLGLGATIMTNRRAIASDDFFVGMFETALVRDEFIVSISFPVCTDSAYVKFAQPASRFALVGVFVSLSPIGQARVAVTGAGPHAFRSTELEQSLTRNLNVESIESIKVEHDSLNSDLHGDARYRASLIPVLAGRAVEKITNRRQHIAKGARGV